MYLGEIRLHWQTLVASAIGIGLGAALNIYTMSLFGPPLLAEFGWSKAQLALLGSIPLFTLVLVPLAGRFTDRFGPRVAAMVGFTAVPLGFAAFTLTSGIGAYLVSHRFDLKNCSLLLSCVTMMIAAASAIGSLILSVTLAQAASYTPFLIVAAVATLLGATLFGMTGSARLRERHTEVEQAVVDQAIVGEIG